MVAWREMSKRARGLLMVVIMLMILTFIGAATPFLIREEKAQASVAEQFELDRLAREKAREQRRVEREEHLARLDQEREEREEQWKKEREEREAQRKAALAKLAKSPSPSPQKRRIRRFRWESPAETRGRLWNIPAEESEEATLTAFLRVCMAESGGHTQDCVGIWQVVKNTRSRSCDRQRIPRITECIEGEGETYLSALRRHQRHALGFIKARNKRAVWIRNLTTDCENPPKGFHGSLDQWDSFHQGRCSQIVSDGRYLIKGELPPPRPGHRVKWLKGYPLTWGGRCEKEGGACDDLIACERGLARIPDTGTLNAFWCRPGLRGCRPDPEPICIKLGYKYEQYESRGRKLWRSVIPTRKLSPRAKRMLVKALKNKQASDGSNTEQEDGTKKTVKVNSTYEDNGRDNTEREESPSGSPSVDLGGPRDDVQGKEKHMEEGAST